MSHKKPSAEEPTEDTVLVERVDAMMDIRYVPKKAEEALQAQPTPKAKDKPTTGGVTTVDSPIDIFKDLNKVPSLTTETEVPPVPQAKIDLEADVLDKVVDEILVAESDALLAAEDTIAKVAPPEKPATKSQHGSKFKRFFH